MVWVRVAGVGIDGWWVVWAIDVLICDEKLKPCDPGAMWLAWCNGKMIKKSSDLNGLSGAGGSL